MTMFFFPGCINSMIAFFSLERRHETDHIATSTLFNGSSGGFGASFSGVRSNAEIRQGILQTLLLPFEAADRWGNGILRFQIFYQCLEELCGGAIRSHSHLFPATEEVARLAEFFTAILPNKLVGAPRGPMSRSMSTTKALSRVEKDRYLQGQETEAVINRDFGKKSTQYLGDFSSDDEDETSSSDDDKIKDFYVEYHAFCRHLLTALVSERRNAYARKTSSSSPRAQKSAAGWLAREMELLDALLYQLEAMPSRQRRKTLMRMSQSLTSLMSTTSELNYRDNFQSGRRVQCSLPSILYNNSA